MSDSIFDYFFPAPAHSGYTLEGKRGAVLIIHGYTGSPPELRVIADTLHQRGWHVEVPLLPGYGDQIRYLRDYTRFDWMDCLRQVWDKLHRNYATCVVMGHSMGGALAINLAAESAPDKLVLMAPFWKPNPKTLTEKIKVALMPILHRIVTLQKPYIAGNFDDQALHTTLSRKAPDLDLDNPATQKRIREEFTLPSSAYNELRLIGKSAYRLAPQIHVPTLVIQGREDVVTTPANTQKMTSRINGQVTLKEFDDGHELVLPHSPNAQPIANIIAGYLED